MCILLRTRENIKIAYSLIILTNLNNSYYVINSLNQEYTRKSSEKKKENKGNRVKKSMFAERYDENIRKEGCLAGSVIECLPLAQGMIPGSRDQVPHRAPCEELASLCLCLSLFLCVSHE